MRGQAPRATLAARFLTEPRQEGDSQRRTPGKWESLLQLAAPSCALPRLPTAASQSSALLNVWQLQKARTFFMKCVSFRTARC